MASEEGHCLSLSLFSHTHTRSRIRISASAKRLCREGFPCFGFLLQISWIWAKCFSLTAIVTGHRTQHKSTICEKVSSKQKTPELHCSQRNENTKQACFQTFLLFVRPFPNSSRNRYTQNRSQYAAKRKQRVTLCA